MREFITSNNIRYPVVVASKDDGRLEVVMASSELVAFKGNAQKLVEGLREKGYMNEHRASL
jgi:hypothetical protein